MKKIVVFSDIHYNCVPEKVKSVANEADYLFFLGDGGSRLGDLLFHHGLVAVRRTDCRCGFGAIQVLLRSRRYPYGRCLNCLMRSFQVY